MMAGQIGPDLYGPPGRFHCGIQFPRPKPAGAQRKPVARLAPHSNKLAEDRNCLFCLEEDDLRVSKEDTQKLCP